MYQMVCVCFQFGAIRAAWIDARCKCISNVECFCYAVARHKVLYVENRLKKVFRLF